MDELKTNGEVDLISRPEAMDAIRSMTISLGGKEIFHPEAKKSVLNALDDLHSVDAEPVRHGRWKHIKKHLWHKDKNGEIDMWYVDHGFHNGPGCEICGLSFCEHCEPNWAEDECEIGYYVCSECEQPTKTGDSKYCPNCGAKMDLEARRMNHDSCEDCDHDLGGGCCRINAEAERREGGGFELKEEKTDEDHD